jgi:predicted small secreted protein
MKTFRLLVTALLVATSMGLNSCKNDITGNNNDDNIIDEYYSMLYGSWYGEINGELSKTFISYKFSTNKQIVRYTKTAKRSKWSMNGNIGYSDWEVDNEYSTYGLWYLEKMGETNLIYLKIQWDGNDFYSGHLINYLDDNILHFENGFSIDLSKGDKSPNF